MAVVNIDSDVNLRDVSMVDTVDTFTVRFGATLTVDSSNQPAGKIPADMTVLNGEVHIDGRNVREIAYSSGSGTLPSVGDTVTWNAGADSGVVGELLSGTNVTGVMSITIGASAAEIDSADSLASGGWTADVDSAKIGHMRFGGGDASWVFGANATLRVTGDWYELGTGDGTNGQTFTLPFLNATNVVWVETGNGTGVFEKWHYFYHDEANTVFYAAWEDWGVGYEDGKVFALNTSTGVITFGTTTNGGAPANGARVRIPNVRLQTLTGGVEPGIDTSLASVSAINGSAEPGTILADKCDFGTRLWQSGANLKVELTYCAIPAMNSTYALNAPLTSCLVEECVFGGGVSVTGSWYHVPFTIVDSLSGLTFKNNIVLSGKDGNSAPVVEFVTSSDISMEGQNKFIFSQQDENGVSALEFDQTKNVIADSIVCIGAGLRIANSSVVISEFVTGAAPTRGTTEDTVDTIGVLGRGSVGVHINSIRLCEDGAYFGPNNGNPISVSDASDVLIQNWGAVDAKVDCGGRVADPIAINGVASDVTIKNIWLDNVQEAVPWSVTGTVKNLNIISCCFDYAATTAIDANNSRVQGLHCGSGAPNASDGVDGDYISTIDHAFLDIFTSDTTGAICLVFPMVGEAQAGYISHLNGAYVNGDGDLYLPNSNSEAIYEYPWDVLGHTAFSSDPIRISGTDSAKARYWYDIDDGTGYSGTWTELSQSAGGNTALAADSPTNMEQGGWKIKFRITRGATMDSNDFINGFQVMTTTTIAAQKANPYPDPGIQLTITGLPTGTDVVILEDDTTTVLHHTDSSSGDVVFDYATQQTVDIKFYNPGYIPEAVLNYALGSVNATLPVTMRPDPSYST